MESTVVVLVLTFNEVENTLKCLKSVYAINYENLNIYLIDNGSSSGYIKPIKNIYSDLQVITLPKNGGYAGGFNEGMKYLYQNQVEFDYLWLITNDLEVEPDALGKQVRVMEKERTIGFLGPETYKRYGSGEHDQWINALAHKDNPCSIIMCNEMNTRGRDMVEVEFVVGHCLLVRKEIIQDVGLIRDFFIYWEEREWQWRAKLQGWSTYVVPGSICYHDRDSFGKPFNTYLRIRNFLFFNRIVLFNDSKFTKHFIRNIFTELKWSVKMTVKRKWDGKHFYHFIKGFLHGFLYKVPGFDRIS